MRINTPTTFNNETVATREWVEAEFRQGQGADDALPKENTMYYGWLPASGDVFKISDIEDSMLEVASVQRCLASPSARLSAIDNPAGSLVFALVPVSSRLTVQKFDGLSGYLPFEEDNGAVGTGANGIEITIGNIPYLAFGEFSIVSGEMFFKAMDNESASLEDAPVDGKSYMRCNGEWIESSGQQQHLLPVGPCSDIGIVYTPESVIITWADPADLEISGIVSEWRKTVLVKKVGSYPENHEDGTMVTENVIRNSCRYNAVECASNNFLPATGMFGDDTEYWKMDHGTMVIGNSASDYTIGEAIPSGEWYVENPDRPYYKLFSYSTNGTWNCNVKNNLPLESDLSWSMLKALVKRGEIQNYLEIGDLLTAKHSEYFFNLRVEGFDKDAPVDNTVTHTLRLGCDRCVIKAQYDAAEINYAQTKDTQAISGKVYYVSGVDDYVALVEGTDWVQGDVMTTASVPIVQWYEKNPDEWRSKNGNNYYAVSNIAQWLDSDGVRNEWYSPTHLFDTCSVTLINKHGFLYGLEENLKDALLPVRVPLRRPDLDGGGLVEYEGKCFLRSRTEVENQWNNGTKEGNFLTYFGSYAIRNMPLDGTDVTWWYRSSEYNNNTVVHGWDKKNYFQRWNDAVLELGVSPSVVLG